VGRLGRDQTILNLGPQALDRLLVLVPDLDVFLDG
jgi:hypothetical protein